MKKRPSIAIAARFGLWAAAVSFAAFSAPSAEAAETLTICHGGHPIMEASIKILDKWAKKIDVSLNSTVIAYAIYVPKVTQLLTTNSPQCDIIWHKLTSRECAALSLIP